MCIVRQAVRVCVLANSVAFIWRIRTKNICFFPSSSAASGAFIGTRIRSSRNFFVAVYKFLFVHRTLTHTHNANTITRNRTQQFESILLFLFGILFSTTIRENGNLCTYAFASNSFFSSFSYFISFVECWASRVGRPMCFFALFAHFSYKFSLRLLITSILWCYNLFMYARTSQVVVE